MNLIEQSIEKSMENLREQIYNFWDGMLALHIQPVSHKEFMCFQNKVMSLLTSLESMVEALTTRIETRD